jgi:hypothetical protein
MHYSHTSSNFHAELISESVVLNSLSFVLGNTILLDFYYFTASCFSIRRQSFFLTVGCVAEIRVGPPVCQPASGCRVQCKPV